jgi:hypothetical protein
MSLTNNMRGDAALADQVNLLGYFGPVAGFRAAISATSQMLPPENAG